MEPAGARLHFDKDIGFRFVEASCYLQCDSLPGLTTTATKNLFDRLHATVDGTQGPLPAVIRIAIERRYSIFRESLTVWAEEEVPPPDVLQTQLHHMKELLQGEKFLSTIADSFLVGPFSLPPPTNHCTNVDILNLFFASYCHLLRDRPLELGVPRDFRIFFKEVFGPIIRRGLRIPNKTGESYVGVVCTHSSWHDLDDESGRVPHRCLEMVPQGMSDLGCSTASARRTEGRRDPTRSAERIRSGRSEYDQPPSSSAPSSPAARRQDPPRPAPPNLRTNTPFPLNRFDGYRETTSLTDVYRESINPARSSGHLPAPSSILGGKRSHDDVSRDVDARSRQSAPTPSGSGAKRKHDRVFTDATNGADRPRKKQRVEAGSSSGPAGRPAA